MFDFTARLDRFVIPIILSPIPLLEVCIEVVVIRLHFVQRVRVDKLEYGPTAAADGEPKGLNGLSTAAVGASKKVSQDRRARDLAEEARIKGKAAAKGMV